MVSGFFDPHNWIPALAMAGCGVLVFLVLVNQRLLVVRDSRHQTAHAGVVFVLLTGGGFLLSLALPFVWRVALPVLVHRH